mmetsp:Transcript_37832/g.114279  ORF Transcript_37832/g.114279 Transcript_37832/m.114279 type:complete len:306 (-) Transcript_37832:67-984(-)
MAEPVADPPISDASWVSASSAKSWSPANSAPAATISASAGSSPASKLGFSRRNTCMRGNFSISACHSSSSMNGSSSEASLAASGAAWTCPSASSSSSANNVDRRVLSKRVTNLSISAFSFCRCASSISNRVNSLIASLGGSFSFARSSAKASHVSTSSSSMRSATCIWLALRRCFSFTRRRTSICDKIDILISRPSTLSCKRQTMCSAIRISRRMALTYHCRSMASGTQRKLFTSSASNSSTSSEMTCSLMRQCVTGCSSNIRCTNSTGCTSKWKRIRWPMKEMPSFSPVSRSSNNMKTTFMQFM